MTVSLLFVFDLWSSVELKGSLRPYRGLSWDPGEEVDNLWK